MSLLQLEGRFNAKVIDAELGELQNENKTPYLLLKFDTSEGSVFGRVWLSEKAFDRSLETLKECFNFAGNFDALDLLVGLECSITTEYEEYQTDEGLQQTLRVKWINPKGSKAQMDEGARESLARKLSAKAGYKTSSLAVSTEDVPF